MFSVLRLRNTGLKSSLSHRASTAAAIAGINDAKLCLPNAFLYTIIYGAFPENINVFADTCTFLRLYGRPLTVHQYMYYKSILLSTFVLAS